MREKNSNFYLGRESKKWKITRSEFYDTFRSVSRNERTVARENIWSLVESFMRVVENILEFH